MNKNVLRWNFVFQYGFVLTNIFNALLLLPLYLKNIDADTLGIWLATGSIMGWMFLADPGVGEILQQRIAEFRGRKETGEIGRMIGSGLMASGFVLIIAMLAGFTFFSLLETIIDKNVNDYENLGPALLLTIVSTALSLFSFSLSGINQGLHNSAHVAISQLSANFLFLFVNLYFLFAGWGVLSIAIANIARAAFINAFNFISLLLVLKKEETNIVFEWLHFKKFIRIFSFTSASKIITGISTTMDMIILARFIPAAMITMYEINKRPVTITQSLIGRHSVALMPLVSHARGTGDKKGILRLINTQFKFYAYAALLASALFCINYRELITVWTGEGNYLGDAVMLMLVTSFFFTLIGYFMANIGYALGDIKRNSLANIVRGIVLGTGMYFAARHFGITGTLVVWIAVAMIIDFFYFSYRLFQLGYLDAAFLKNTLKKWAVIFPAGLLLAWLVRYAMGAWIPEDNRIIKILAGSLLYCIAFASTVLLSDASLRKTVVKQMKKIVGKKVKMNAYA